MCCLSLLYKLTHSTQAHTPPHTAQSREQCVCVVLGLCFLNFLFANQFRFLISSRPPHHKAPTRQATTCCPASPTTQEEDTGRLLGCFYSSVASSSWWWVACPGRRASCWRPAPPPPPVGPVCCWGRRIVRVRRRPSRPLCPGLFLGTCKHTQGGSWKTEPGESRGEPQS